MCGIFGAINCSSIDDKKFEHSVKLLSHRGPDNLKIKKWDSVAFGFTRLAIQDLSELGDQPMSHATQPICIVFNGEIYNYKELRSDLLKEGASFVSESDTEVILNGYLHWGWEKTLEKLEGMFGLALYDEQQRQIEDDIVPPGIFSKPDLEPEVYVEGGDVWTVVGESKVY